MTPEELNTVWEKQVNKLISLGFNDEIHKSEGTYRRLMPKFAPQPPEYAGRFDIPLLVESRIPLKIQHKLAKITSAINEQHIVDTTKVPGEPYSIWTHNGERYRQLSIIAAVSKFLPDEIASPQIEVTSLYIHYPELFREHGIDASGSVYGSDSVPCIDTFLGTPGLNHGPLDHPDSRWGPLSRGRSIQFSTNHPHIFQ
jgi:hypothetical protein